MGNAECFHMDLSTNVGQEQALKRQELREQERKNREELRRKVFNKFTIGNYINIPSV